MATNSLLITQYILKILEADESLMNIISIDKFLPLDAREGTSFPFAVIQRNNVNESRCKDGLYEDKVSFTIIVVNDNYINCVTIANMVRNVLESYNWHDDNFYLRDIRLSNASEALYNNAFIQTLDFNATVNNP